MNVPRDYETRFEKAEQTFLYQVVYDPNTNKLLPLNPLPDDIEPEHLNFAGQYPFICSLIFILYFSNSLLPPNHDENRTVSSSRV
jgi:hypothetical protein